MAHGLVVRYGQGRFVDRKRHRDAGNGLMRAFMCDFKCDRVQIPKEQPMSEQAFAGKTALITGGSRGIGKGVALRLAGEGAKVAVNYLSNQATADATVAEIESAGGAAVAIQGDVSQPEEAARIVEETRATCGPINILVHSAGLSIVKPATDVTWDDWKTTMNINLDGTFNMVYAVKDEMIEQGAGAIVCLSSVAALRERENQVPYAASKAAVIAMVRCCAQAWGRHGVRINAVCPGLVKTDMADTLSPETQKSILANTPLGRLGEPADIASLVRFLVSDESSWITGQAMVASGGRVMLPG
jgi:3-oxoacyl-[acyl-carrier protein] reductase